MAGEGESQESILSTKEQHLPVAYSYGCCTGEGTSHAVTLRILGCS